MDFPPPSNPAQRLFTAALDHAPEDREAFLAIACGDDEELLAEVESLLTSEVEEFDQTIPHRRSESSASTPVDSDHTILHDRSGVSPPLKKGKSSAGFEDLPTIPADRPVVVPSPENSDLTGLGADPDAPVPFVFGQRIAQGGMGAILEANDCKLGRTIAAKVMLLKTGADLDQQQRFVQEAAVLGRLEHPNIVPIHDLGRDSEGQLYYTMKLVQGRTLQDIIDDLREGQPEALHEYPMERLLEIFRKVCDAIAFAHSRRILHRDLKPENVMVGEFGEVLVMDWGLSKILDAPPESDLADSPAPDSGPVDTTASGSFTATLQGSVMGTPKYMSPEQAMGLIDELDERSDIFSLGSILYAILTLRPPVEGDTLEEVLDKVSNASITPLTVTSSAMDPRVKGKVLDAKEIKPLPHLPTGRVPAALSSVVMKALTLKKEDRYQTVSDFSADIEAYQSGFATSAEQAGLGKQLILLYRRNKGIFTTAAAAWVLITALAVMFVLNLRAKERRAVAGEEAAKTAEGIALKNEEEARRSSAEANIALADASLREGNGVAVQAALARVPEDLRDTTWNYLHRQSDTSLESFPPEGLSNIVDAAPHPRLPSVFAIAHSDNRITLLNIKTGERLLEFNTSFTDKRWVSWLRIAISPDGKRIALGQVSGNGGLTIHSLEDGRKLAEWESRKTSRLQFSPDGTLLLQGTHLGERGFNRFGTAMGVWQVEGGRQLWEREKGQAQIGAFTPDGRHVALLRSFQSPKLLKAEDGRPVADFSEQQIGGVFSAAIGATGRIAVADNQGLVTIFAPNKGSVQSRLPLYEVWNLAWTPDGTKLVTAVVTREGRQEIKVWDAGSGTATRSLLGGSLEIETLKVHPLSGELIVTGPDARAWDLTGATPIRKLPPTSEGAFAFWGSESRAIAPVYSNRDSILAVQDLQADKLSVVWRPKINRQRISVSADGRWATLAKAHWLPEQEIVTLRRSTDGKVDQITSIPLSKPARIDHLRLSPPGAQVVAFYDTDLHRFDTTSGERLPKLESGDYMAYNDIGWLGKERIVGVVTSKAARLKPGSEEQVVLWDAITGQIVKAVTGSTPMDRLSVAPAGNRFAEAGEDKKVRIRDGETLDVLQEFRAHDGPITALLWHPNKAILATASVDLSIRLWDLDTGLMVEEFRGPVTEIRSLSFSPGGKLLSCAAENDSPRIWEPESLKDPQTDAIPLDEHAGNPIEKPPPPETPSSPASKVPEKEPEPDSEGWSDLLAVLTPEIVERKGNGWRMKDGIVSSSDEKEFGQLMLPGNFSNASYRLRTRVREASRGKVFHVALPIGDRMTGFDLDGYQGKFTGLEKINNERLNVLANAIKGKQINDSEWHVLDLIVKLEGNQATVTALLDDQDFYEWSGPVSALSHNEAWNKPTDGIDSGQIALGMMAEGWEVSDVRVKRLAE